MQHIAVEVFSQQAGCVFESRCAKFNTVPSALILSILYSLLTWDSAIAWVAFQSKGAHNFNPKGNLCRWTAVPNPLRVVQVAVSSGRFLVEASGLSRYV